MRIITKIKDSFIKRTISSLLLGKWISYSDWMWTIKEQSSKGFEKYGHYIDECPKDKFNWTNMALEELIDFWVYKEKMRR